MISLDSFSSYGHFAGVKFRAREFSNNLHNSKLFEDDLKVIQDLTTKLVPKLLWDILDFFASGTQVPLDSERKQYGFKFDFADIDHDARKLEYEDCSIILDSENPFHESKTKFDLKDFKYYTINLESDGNYFQKPRSIFIRGVLNSEAKYHKDLVLQFSYMNFDNNGIEDGTVIYSRSEAFLEEHFRAHVSQDQNFTGGAFIVDIPAPSASDKNAIKQILLLKSGFALRTV